MRSCTRTHSSFVFGAVAALTLVLSANAGANSCGHISMPQIEHVLNLPRVQVLRNARPGVSECNLRFYSGRRPTDARIRGDMRSYGNGSLVDFGIQKETPTGGSVGSIEERLQRSEKEFRKGLAREVTFAPLGAEHVVGGQVKQAKFNPSHPPPLGYRNVQAVDAMWWNTTMTPELIVMGLQGSRHKPLVKQLGKIAETVIPAFL